jgi:hypothetical protein
MNNSSLILPAAVYNKTPAPHLSAKYVHVDSEAVVANMLAEGFVVAGVQTTSTRARNALTGRHVIDFRHPDVPRIGDSTPRVLFGNSHDGSTRAYAMAGVFRFVCSNGMVVGSMYARESVRHSGDAARDLIERMKALASNTAPLFSQIESWQRKQLSAAQSFDFARLAAQLRWGDPDRFAPEDLLRVNRAEDDRGDLWTVFNRIQEATTKGGVAGRSVTGRATVARPLAEPAANVRFNEQLWSLAEEFAGT